MAKTQQKTNTSKKEHKPKLQVIHLKSGLEVVVDWNSKQKCKCGAEFWFALTKNKKFIPIVLVGLCEWETHFADCPFANKFRKK